MHCHGMQPCRRSGSTFVSQRIMHMQDIVPQDGSLALYYTAWHLAQSIPDLRCDTAVTAFMFWKGRLR